MEKFEHFINIKELASRIGVPRARLSTAFKFSSAAGLSDKEVKDMHVKLDEHVKEIKSKLNK